MDRQKIEKIICNQAPAFIGSVDEQGFPQVKAMLAPRLIEDFRIFYFTTNTSSKRVVQYLKNPKACVYFCDQQGDTMYYSQGVDDPDYAVLKFTAQKCRVYEDFSSEEFAL